VNFEGAGSAEARRFGADGALMRLRDYRADDLRLDAVHAVIDGPAGHILKELAGAHSGIGDLVVPVDALAVVGVQH
jgi:maltooligosyltrehalose trehalohydrolase